MVSKNWLENKSLRICFFAYILYFYNLIRPSKKRKAWNILGLPLYLLKKKVYIKTWNPWAFKYKCLRSENMNFYSSFSKGRDALFGLTIWLVFLTLFLIIVI